MATRITPSFYSNPNVEITGQTITYFDLAGQERELTGLLGWTVDLREPGELSWYFRQRVLGEAQVIYERS